MNQPHPPNHRRPKSGQLSLEGEAERIPGIRGAGGSKGPAGSERPTMPPAITIPTTDSLRQQNLNEFCRFRDDGPHSLPSICDVFIYCVHGIGSFEICKNGTKFNPEVLGCDHAVNFECAFSGIDCKFIIISQQGHDPSQGGKLSSLTFNNKKKNNFENSLERFGKIEFIFSLFFSTNTVSEVRTIITQPPPLHNNLCYFRGYGELPDPLTCDHYYACTNSRSIRMTCPAGLHFKPTGERSGLCDYPYNVNCKNGNRGMDRKFHPKDTKKP